MIKIIKNVTVYSPLYLGKKDILICNNKIAKIDEKIEIRGINDIEIIDFNGCIATSGLIDQHVHVTGGGREASFHSKVPEISISQLFKSGITTVVGLLGTDGYTITLDNLYAKIKALNNEGITAYMYTGCYALPGPTLTDSIIRDMLLIDSVIGLKFAISDHRSSFPSDKNILDAYQQIRVGGMISGKGGVLHMHLGHSDSQLNQIIRLIKDHQLPIKHFAPTHTAKNKPLLENALEFTKLGGTIDITTAGSCYATVPEALAYIKEKGVDLNQVTMSSDSNGSIPQFNKDGIMVKLGVGSSYENIKVLQNVINNKILTIEEVLPMFTTNVSRMLNLPNKGKIAPHFDADIAIWNDDFKLVGLLANGEIVMEKGEVIKKGFFE